MDDKIVLKGVSYTYPNAPEKTLKEINCEINGEDFTVIMGKTGAGKTTLAMLFNGIIPQLLEGHLEGEVHVAGLDLSQYRVQTITKNVGLVLQDPESQVFGRTVEEDVAFGPRNYLIPRAEIFQRIEDSLAKVRLDDYNKRLTSQLSGGEKQRLAIAGVLAMEPTVLILDEPTSELDPLGREEIYTTISTLQKDRNLTILAVEHSSQEICERADNLVVIRDGSIAWMGRPEVFFRDLDLVEENGIKPIPVSKIGWDLYKKGLIAQEEIPLNADKAAQLIARLLKGRKLVAEQGGEKEPRFQLGEPIITIDGLTYEYGNGKKALDNLSLTINKGDYIALIGQNGAGKTTLAKHLNSIFKPTKGTVQVCALDTRDYEPEDLAEHIGYVFQNPDHQIFSSTVYKELEFGLKNKGLSPKEVSERIAEVMELTGISHLKDEHPFSLGKGERQKIAVASILVLKPRILVVDEPTTGQDWAGINVMMDLMDTLHSRGTTIVMVTHDMDVVAQHANRAIVLNQGRIIADGAVADVLADVETLKKSYVYPPQVVELSLKLRQFGLDRIFTDDVALGKVIMGSLEGDQC